MIEQHTALRLADALERAVKQEDADDQVISVARWFVDDAAAELRRLHAEVEEQCRLNGMGSEREAKLLAEVEALRATLGALHYHCKFGDGLMASTIVDECERAVPKLAAIDAAKERA